MATEFRALALGACAGARSHEQLRARALASASLAGVAHIGQMADVSTPPWPHDKSVPATAGPLAIHHGRSHGIRASEIWTWTASGRQGVPASASVPGRLGARSLGRTV